MIRNGLDGMNSGSNLGPNFQAPPSPALVGGNATTSGMNLNGTGGSGMENKMNGKVELKNQVNTAVDNVLRRRSFFEIAEADMFVLGVVCNKTDAGLTIKISEVSVDEGVEPFLSFLDDLCLEGLCPLRELSSSSVDMFALGDRLRAVIFSISLHSEEIYLSLNKNRIPSKSIKLGITHSPVLTNQGSSSRLIYANNPYLDVSSSPPISPMHTPNAYVKKRSFRASLVDHPFFCNPESVSIMINAYDIDDKGSLLSASKNRSSESYMDLRTTQNKNWASDSVKRGIVFSKAGDSENLILACKCYAHALEIDPTFVDAYIARGAAYVLLNRLQDSIKEFRIALKYDPENVNAKKYLTIAEERIIEQKQVQMKQAAPTSVQKDPKELSKQKLARVESSFFSFYLELLLAEEKAKLVSKEKRSRKLSDSDESDDGRKRPKYDRSSELKKKAK